MISEHFLREIWKDHRNFIHSPVLLSDGSPIEIIAAGTENDHRGGPDFLSAKIAIDGIQLSGDVEIHITPEGWHEHGHGHDARYSNVILHVVLEDLTDIAGPPIPHLILRNNLTFGHADLWDALFRKFYDRSPELPCFPHNLLVPLKFKRTVLDQFGEARLEELIDRVSIPDEISSDSEMLERVYQLTMDALGYSQNRVPFRELSSLLPISRLQFIRTSFQDHRRVAFEAAFFGVAGLLPKPSLGFDTETNEYLLELNSRWNAIQQSIRFPEVLAEHDWAFFRIRSANTPYRRLALAAALAERYFSQPDWNFRHEFFLSGPNSSLDHHPYWELHSSFASAQLTPQTLLGDERASAIRLNVILPAQIAKIRTEPQNPTNKRSHRELMLEWGSSRTNASAKYLATVEQELLEGERVNSVRSEQGSLLLQRNFCERLRCSKCPIGNRLIEKGWQPPGKLRE